MLHASWNAIAHWIPDKTTSLTLDNLGGLLCAIPLAFLAIGPDPAVPAAAVARRGRTMWREIRPVWHIGLAGGAMSVLAYGLVDAVFTTHHRHAG